MIHLWQHLHRQRYSIRGVSSTAGSNMHTHSRGLGGLLKLREKEKTTKSSLQGKRQSQGRCDTNFCLKILIKTINIPSLRFDGKILFAEQRIFRLRPFPVTG